MIYMIIYIYIMIMKHFCIVAISVFFPCNLGYFDTKSEFTEYSGIV